MEHTFVRVFGFHSGVDDHRQIGYVLLNRALDGGLEALDKGMQFVNDLLYILHHFASDFCVWLITKIHPVVQLVVSVVEID